MLRSFWNGLWGAAGAAAGSQAPEFIQQYTQRLGGHVDELRGLVDTVPAVQPRLEVLAAAQASLENAAGAGKLWALASHFQPDIFRGTLQAYVPATPLTVEGLLYALVGVGIGVMIGGLVLLPFRLLSPRRHHRH